MTAFLAELQRRHVYKVGAMYAVAGWLLVQVATQVFPFFGISNGAVRWAVLAIVAGFPAALVLAWVFDLTPQGVVRTDRLPPDAAPPPSAGSLRRERRLNIVLGALVVLGLAYFIAPRAGWLAGPSGAGGDTRSIAVLPFENLSDEKANAYFASGIQDEILTKLARIGALKVISRTSTARYASSPDNLPQIARELGVANILEGSVQRAGDAVHINVQLIRAVTDEHLWAQSYDRRLDDIFAVQGEIAQAIAEALRATLTGVEAHDLEAKPTSNPIAYDAYLRALALEARYTTDTQALRERVDAYRHVVDLDPNFAAAWARLSQANVELYFNLDTTPQRLQAARDALDRASTLAPDASETFEARGLYHYWGLGEYDAAFEAYSEALKRKPNAATILYALGNVRRRQGRWAEGLPFQERAVEVDPLNAQIAYNLGLTLLALGRFDDALRADDRGLAASPGDPELLAAKLTVAQARGDMKAAHAQAEAIPLTTRDLGALAQRFEQWRLERDDARNVRELLPLLGDPAFEKVARTRLLLDLGAAELGSGATASGRAHLAECRGLTEQARSEGNQSPYDFLPLTYAAAFLGDADAARRYAEQGLKEMANDAIGLPQMQLAQAVAAMTAGDRSLALDALTRAQSRPMVWGPWPGVLAVDPTFDGLRSDPRFVRLATARPVPP